MNLENGWNLDQKSGHLTHESGLYAYLAESYTESGGIRCLGPYSSYSHKLNREDVYRLTASAIYSIENLYRERDLYTLWGSFSKPSSPTSMINVLGEDCGFIPNPILRSSVLLEQQDGIQNSFLKREWSENQDDKGIRHRIGLSFIFAHRERDSTIVCTVEKSDSVDPQAIQDEIGHLSIVGLCTTAMAVAKQLKFREFTEHRKCSVQVNYGSSFNDL